ncbi:MAG: alpha-L-fucosidase [Phycisphaeraceae bacterium]
MNSDQYVVPVTDEAFTRDRYYTGDVPVPEYRHASDQAYEAFRDLKYGIRIVWGLYALKHLEASWDFVLTMNDAQRQDYQQWYRQFNPRQFDAEQWMDMFQRFGLKMFTLTTKHCDGFSLFDTKTRVRQRVNWTAPGGPALEECDLAFSVMDTPFRRDIVKELCDAAHKRGIAIDLYFSHPDWYDADFRNFFFHPVQTPEYLRDPLMYGNARGVMETPLLMAPDPTPAQIGRMMRRYSGQLRELLTNYGKVDMVCFDASLGPKVWPQVRQLMIELRNLQPDVMFRARGIGPYGDYYTPENFIPGGKEPTQMPWFVIHCLAKQYAYDPDASRYRDGRWIILNLIDTVAKGGNFMVTVGPDENGVFHPKAIEAFEEAGRWLVVNGLAIYGTRARDGELWHEGESVHFTRSKDHRQTYVFSREWPGAKLVLNTVRARSGSQVRMLGVNEPLKWRQDGQELTIKLPPALQQEENRPCRHAWTWVVESEAQ